MRRHGGKLLLMPNDPGLKYCVNLPRKATSQDRKQVLTQTLDFPHPIQLSSAVR